MSNRVPRFKTPPMSKIGSTAGITDRNIARPEPVLAKDGAGDNRIQVDTYFTSLPVPSRPTPIVYNGDRNWVRVTLTLETAGPVSVGNMSNLAPVLSGKGRLLQTGVPAEFYVAKGSRLWIESTGINRITRQVEALPWLEQLAGLSGIISSK